jgi:hypothetical protein
VCQLTDWIPSLTTTSLFAGVVWLARSFLITRLTNSVKNEFDSKLEVLRSELKAKETQIEALRSGAMSGLLTRQGALYQRKLLAIDQIWRCFKEIEKSKYLSVTLSTLNFEELAKQSAKNPKFSELINIIGGNIELKDIDMSGSKLAQPFLTPLAWAYFSAYSSIIMQAVAVMQILKIGVDNVARYLNFEHTNNLLKTVLPHQKKYIEKYGMSCHHYLLDEIEELLLLELRNIQDGRVDDKENTRRAAEINKEVEKVFNEVAEMQARA